ncbi:MAG: hypothetical protein LBK67_03875, partial [Coriobacteriales bacterium]|jgi:hypothetical protein|nr:hypothetical protein [Coriobacteriales bacterium]
MRKHAKEHPCEITSGRQSTDEILSELLGCAHSDPADSSEHVGGSEDLESDQKFIECTQKSSTVISQDQNPCQSFSKWLRQWSSAGVYPQTAPTNTRDINQVLLQNGLIERTEKKGWRATETGKRIGIVSCVGSDANNNEYAYCEYTVAAANEILKMLQDLKF